jgi:uncharacterized protein
MHIAAAPTVTLIFTAALGLINLWLAARVVQARRTHKIATGSGAVPQLEARMRAHSNFTEYVPITLVLMLLVEMNVGAERGLWAAGALLVAGRVLHPFGMDRPYPNPYRMVGMILTALVLVALVVWAVLIAYGVAR